MKFYKNGETYEERIHSIYDLLDSCMIDSEEEFDDLDISVKCLDKALAQLRHRAIVRMICATYSTDYVRDQDPTALEQAEIITRNIFNI